MIITQLIYLNEGGEKDFLEYESIVLPLLEKYNGKLKYRVRPSRESFIYPFDDELPFEIHIVSFGTAADLENYKQDPIRIKHQELFQRAVKRAVILESPENGDKQ